MTERKDLEDLNDANVASSSEGAVTSTSTKTTNLAAIFSESHYPATMMRVTGTSSTSSAFTRSNRDIKRKRVDEYVNMMMMDYSIGSSSGSNEKCSFEEGYTSIEEEEDANSTTDTESTSRATVASSARDTPVDVEIGITFQYFKTLPITVRQKILRNAMRLFPRIIEFRKPGIRMKDANGFPREKWIVSASSIPTLLSVNKEARATLLPFYNTFIFDFLVEDNEQRLAKNLLMNFEHDTLFIRARELCTRYYDSEPLWDSFKDIFGLSFQSILNDNLKSLAVNTKMQHIMKYELEQGVEGLEKFLVVSDSFPRAWYNTQGRVVEFKPRQNTELRRVPFDTKMIQWEDVEWVGDFEQVSCVWSKGDGALDDDEYNY
ncbi:uncharacterized protein LY89DRAFT_728239 [Mollisia scopiformis]|uniref:2EXR domain-containing protein n=1 Tax=Mollisia scopiformis TaxID=149040 RepID=A0A194XTF8_MOLSC|nr:uncharacterized protein LY89DRAFT_728239 [Mollisia scopiformis]KUJ23493.1 hypothetical protein LY89DRAFT_728239 [Mollisia scopiformis]